MRFGNLLVMCQFCTLPADLTRRNLELFARELMPTLRTNARKLAIFFFVRSDAGKNV
jgi:hypothetical protein